MRAIRSKNEYIYDKTDDFSLEDSQKSAMVAYRSALISKESLGLMDGYVVDSRLEAMINLLTEIIKLLGKLIKDADLLLKEIKCQKNAAAQN